MSAYDRDDEQRTEAPWPGWSGVRVGVDHTTRGGVDRDGADR